MIFESPEKAAMRVLSHNVADSFRRYFINLIGKYKKQGPQITDFSDVYGGKTVSEDRLKVLNSLANFEKSRTDEEKELKFYADVLEMIIMEFSNAWLPGFLSKASNYDDINNQTDLVLELLGDNEEILPIAIDVTSAANEAPQKIRQIVGKLRGQEFNHLKYYESQLGDFRGGLDMPRIVVGADRNRIIELAQLFHEFMTSTSEHRRTKGAEITDHPFGTRLFLLVLDSINTYINILNKQYPESVKLQNLQKIRNTLENYQMEKTLDVARARKGLDAVCESIEHALNNAA